MTLALAGFSLIELLLGLAVAMVLALCAYPGFQSLVLASRRIDARVALLQLQQRQERWRAQHSRYADLAELGASRHSPLGHYELGVQAASSSGFELLATASGGQAQDAGCRVLRIIQAAGETVYASGPDAHTLNTRDGNQLCWPR